MHRLKASAQQLAAGVPAYSGRKNVFALVPRSAEVLRIDQFNFAFDSCVLLPRPSPRAIARPRRTGLTLCADLISYAERHPHKELVLAGHTDTVGSDADNEELSRLRAENLHALLTGDAAAWARSCAARCTVEDCQIILTWLAEAHGFACLPGNVDGELGRSTQRAIEQFRYEVEAIDIFEYRAPQHSGPIGEDDYRVFYELYQVSLARLLGILALPRVTPGVPTDQASIDRLQQMAIELHKARKALRFAATPLVGCGETFPCVKPSTAAENRRVEALFFDEGRAPKLSKTPKGVELYGAGRLTPRRLKPRKTAYPPGSVRHVIVMVSGTTDPLNTWSSTHRSNSFSRLGEEGMDDHDEAKVPAYWSRPRSGATAEQNFYWGSDVGLRSALTEIVATAPGVQLFRGHGWDGDNRIQARREAGEQLARELMAEYGEHQAYPVLFHPIGHSHGGNVINELTKAIAADPSWPPAWRIRSVTYLSTPFFQRLHQVDTSRFHPDAVLIAANNKFDLTQRCAADFTVPYLAEVAESSEPALRAQMRFAGSALLASISVAISDLKTVGALSLLGVLQNQPWPFGVHPHDPIVRQAYASHANVFALASDLLSEVDKFLLSLIQVERRPDADAQTSRRQLLSTAVHGQWRAQLAPKRTVLDRARERLTQGQHGDLVDKFQFIGELGTVTLDCLAPIVEFLDFDPSTLRGPLLDLIFATARDFVVDFDDTLTTLDKQLTGSAFAQAIIAVDVSDADKIRRARLADLERKYDVWARKLEDLESQYRASGGQAALLKLLLTIGCQNEEALKKADEILPDLRTWASHALLLGGRVEQVATHLIRVVDKYAKLVRDYSTRGMVQEDPYAEGKMIGTLDYFLYVSHSVSRRRLHAGVEAALRHALDTP